MDRSVGRHYINIVFSVVHRICLCVCLLVVSTLGHASHVKHCGRFKHNNVSITLHNDQ